MNDKNIKDFASLLFSLSPYEFTLLGTILGFILAYPLTIDEQNSLGNFLELAGQVILTINAQAATLSDFNRPNTKSLQKQINSLTLEIERLKANRG